MATHSNRDSIKTALQTYSVRKDKKKEKKGQGREACFFYSLLLEIVYNSLSWSVILYVLLLSFYDVKHFVMSVLINLDKVYC